jgi:hypothetical protein
VQLTVTLTAILVALLGLWALWFAVVGRAVILRQLIAGGVVEVAILAQIGVAFVEVARGYELAEPWTFWGYVVTALFLLPVAAVWALADRTRWSSVVLVVACVAILAMQLRVWQVWSA